MNKEFSEYVKLVDQMRVAQKDADKSHKSSDVVRAQKLGRLVDARTQKLVEAIAAAEAAEKQIKLIPQGQ